MEIKQLKYFIQVAKDSNYTVASKKLFVTQPTLSWTTKKLEEELGFKLFSYNGKKLILTSDGEQFLLQAQHLLNEYTKTIESIHSSHNRITGQIALGIPDLFADCFFIDPLISFIEKYPDIRLKTIHDGSLSIQKMVESEKVDIGVISHLYPPADLDIVDFPHYSYKEILIVNRNHHLASKGSVSFADLKNEEFILLSEEFTLGKLPILQCVNSGFSPDIKLQSSEWSFICDVVAHSNYVSLLPFPLVDKYIKQDGIRIIPIDDEQSVIPISLITKKNSQKSMALQKFITFFINYCIN